MVLEVKTTIIKDGVSYFGTHDIAGEFDRAYKEAQFKSSDQKSTEQILMNVYKELASVGIKAERLTYKDVSYTGIKMANFSIEDLIE